MQLVIDIDDEDYNVILANADFYKEQHWGVAEVWDAIVSGTPLPKGHGDLTDLDALKGELWWVTDCPRVKLNYQALEIWKAIDTAKTVIPADEVN